MNRQYSRKSPWRDILQEVTVQQSLIESLLHTAPESRDNIRVPSVDPCTSPPNVCALSGLDRRGAARSAGGRTLISPSPVRPNTRNLFSKGSPLVTSDQGELTNGVGASTFSHSLSKSRGASKAVEALVKELSTSSWSSDGSERIPELEQGFTPTRNATTSIADMHSPSASTRVTAASDVAQSHREMTDIALFFLKATHIVACEFELRQSIVFSEFAEVTELVSQFVCRVTMTSLPL